MNAFRLILCLLLCFLLCGIWGDLAWGQIASLSPHGDFELEIDCSSCHRTEGWTPVLESLDFDHNRQTQFALTGSHADAACNLCHLDNRFDQPAASSTDCAVCHIDVHQGTFSDNCVDCHNTTLFQEVEGIGVHAQTNFPLTGAHAQLTCINCHVDDTGGAFTALETQCYDCHAEDYTESLIVDHVASGFSTECEQCHTDLQWQGAIFEHVVASNGFDLIGSHEGLACASCHQSPELTTIFQPASDQDCIACHQADYDDEHSGSGFPLTCLDCHNQVTWDDAEEIDHVAVSGGFELLGAHERASCGSCHNPADNSLLFSPPANNQDCITCHRSDYQDGHGGVGVQDTCADCHNLDDWDEVNFDHDQEYFPIFSGEHRNAWDRRTCTTCHLQPENFSFFSCEGACHQHTEERMDREHREVRDYVFESTACLSCHPDGDD